MHRRIIPAIVVLLILALLSGCTGSKPAPQTSNPQPQAETTEQVDTRPFVIAAGTEAISLDPHFDDGPYSCLGQWGAYEALTRHVVKDGGSVGLAPMLAKSWQASDDARVWTFELNQGIKFTDGTDFDAAAVKFNFDRIMAMQKKPIVKLPPIDKVEAVGKYTVKVTLKNPYGALAEAVSKAPFMVSPTVKQHEKDGDWGHAWLEDNSDGTGPYKLDQWVRGQSTSLSKNPGYWQGWNGKHLEKILIKIVKQPSVQLSMLQNGDADFADSISADLVDGLKQAPGINVLEGPSVSVLHIILRQTRGALKDKRVRQAIAYAFDYQGFVQGVFKGHGGTAGVIPVGSWAYDKSLPYYTQDLNKAKQLLADAGYPNGGLKFTIMTLSPFGAYQLREAQILADNLKPLGVEVNIQDVASPATLLAATSKPDEGPEMFLWTQTASINDPEASLRIYPSANFPPAGGNRMFYKNPQVDDLLLKATATADQNERKRMYGQAQKLILEDSVAVYTAQPNTIFSTRSVLKGLKFDPLMADGAPYYYDLYLAKK